MEETRVVCPECKVLEFESTVRHMRATETLMGIVAYFDTRGRNHVHNPNQITHWYKCSMGHEFTVKEDVRCCPADGCGWPGGQGKRDE